MSETPREQTLPRAAQSFMRALWGLELEVRARPSLPPPAAPERPRFAATRLWVPASPLHAAVATRTDYWLAAAAHVSAHVEFGGPRFLVKSLKPVQVAIVSLIEDARVERLATQRYPGLRRLWAPFHVADASSGQSSGALLARLARALFDDTYHDEDAWVSRGRALFFSRNPAWKDPNLSREIGNVLGNDLGQMRVQFAAKGYVVEPCYRDDNLGLWQFEQESGPDAPELAADPDAGRQDELDSAAHDRRKEELEAQPRGPRDPSTGEPTPVLRAALADPAPAAHRYGEWDYVIARERAGFCSLFELSPGAGDPSDIDRAMARYAAVRRRLQRMALRLASKRPVQERLLMAGDRLDMPAAVAAIVARASAQRPDPRVYRRLRFPAEPPALLVLIDMSESLNAVPPGSVVPLLDLARNASALLASTLAGMAKDVAIHGFSSNGREQVQYYRLKDFDQPYDELARARLAGMRASLSTRLGTAMRHAGRALAARRARRKLLMVISDAEPSDVDVHDPKYLLFDAKIATVQNQRLGVKSFCLGLDPRAEGNVRRIFGTGNYLLLSELEALPAKLSEAYLRLST